MTSPRTDTRSPAIVWFRDDLRIADQPALDAACRSGRPVLCLYVLDEGDGPRERGQRFMGGAARWWLHGALEALSARLAKRGASLTLLRGDPLVVVPQVVDETGAGFIAWTRRYGAHEREVDQALKTRLREAGLEVQSFNGQLLYEPWEVKSKVGEPMKVFTPFWRAAREVRLPPAPIPAPKTIRGCDWPEKASLKPLSLAELALEPVKPDWAGGMRAFWTRGEDGAAERLSTFLADEFKGYADDRNRPDLPHTSRLSPHLRFGEISPRQIWHAAEAAVESGRSPASREDLIKFLAELGWREFSYHLLFHNPDLATRNFQQRFDAFPWERNEAALKAWQRGQTGYPIVDAGMRQLWQTGWMHNRVRMIAASFLIKHLLIDWRIGEDWFWDTLVDADVANNPASWQWVAGSGADAAPYFRIFNPIIQGEKFDPNGDYVRTYVPELARLPAGIIQQPWTASKVQLEAAGVKLGSTYPRPIIDHDQARKRALAAFEDLKAKAA